MLGTCQYDPRQHQLIEPPLLNWARRQAPDKETADRIFTYRHRDAGTFVIGFWANKPYGRFVDMLNIGTSLGNFGPSEAGRFKRSLRVTDSADRIRQEVKAGLDSHVRSDQDEADEYYDKYEANRTGRTAVGMST